MLSMTRMFKNDMIVFLILFTYFMVVFYAALYILYPRSGDGYIPTIPAFNNWYEAAKAQMEVALVGNPTPINLNPELMGALGTAEQVCGPGGLGADGWRAAGGWCGGWWLVGLVVHGYPPLSTLHPHILPPLHPSRAPSFHAYTQVTFGIFMVLYFFYVLISLILLLNLFIAMLSNVAPLPRPDAWPLPSSVAPRQPPCTLGSLPY